MRLVSMLRSYPRQNFGSTSPLFSRYTSCKGECVSGEQQGVMPKPLLGPERSMETNPSTDPRAVQKNMDNPKLIRSQICKALHTSNHISFERETPNWGTNGLRRTYRRSGALYLGCRWSKASDAGRSATLAKTIGVVECLLPVLPLHKIC
jgi:hypothetical protein